MYERDLQRTLGVPAVKGRDRRLAELDGADNLLELIRLRGTGNWHVLDDRDGGEYEGYIASTITGSHRMIIEPPIDPYGECTIVEIVDLKNYHREN